MECADVIVIGGGNSAIQIAVELAPTANVTVATRSPLRWMPQRLLDKDAHWRLKRTGLDAVPIGRWVSPTQRVLDLVLTARRSLAASPTTCSSVWTAAR